MSGTLAIHRPAQVPTDEIIGVRHVLSPGGVYKDGRCVEWKITYVPRYRHTLAPRVEPVRVSKHARGRIRPRTKAEQIKMANIRRRAVQARKSMTIDMNRYGAIFDEVPV